MERFQNIPAEYIFKNELKEANSLMEAISEDFGCSFEELGHMVWVDKSPKKISGSIRYKILSDNIIDFQSMKNLIDKYIVTNCCYSSLSKDSISVNVSVNYSNNKHNALVFIDIADLPKELLGLCDYLLSTREHHMNYFSNNELSFINTFELKDTFALTYKDNKLSKISCIFEPVCYANYLYLEELSNKHNLLCNKNKSEDEAVINTVEIIKDSGVRFICEQIDWLRIKDKTLIVPMLHIKCNAK